MVPLIKVPGIRIFRSYAQSHRELIFVFGTDYAEKGFFGQANHLQGEPNTFSIPTLYKVCNSQSDKFFTDDQFDANICKVNERIERIPKDGRPIIWLPKLGKGHSQSYIKAPKTYRYIIEKLKEIEYPNIEFDYEQQIY